TMGQVKLSPIPAAVPIEPGDRLLLSVCPDLGLAIVYPFEVVDLALSALHSDIFGVSDDDA
ncbi:hypothetical protein, partial [Nocardia acididurans]|uniref:hypothetical protein n=1 Tax=Nocardia acididurans TaxID=2802282 RepID=UPI001E31FA7A